MARSTARFALARPEVAARRLEFLQSCFGGRLYVELQRHGLAQEREIEPHLIDLAYRASLPLIASNEPFFASTGDYEAHDALLCIADGTVVGDRARRQLTPEHRFKTRAEMREIFADLPETLANSVEAALRCAYRPLTRKPILPRFSSVAGDEEAEATELMRQAEAGLAARLAKRGLAPGLNEDDYRARLAFELDVIVKMEFPGYFLIVSDFIKYAKGNGIPVGPGRGSGAGSLVAYALTITDLDPLRFGLLFERFLNPERVSMPDFDIDFCQDRRDEVIRYVRERYGADRVAQIITFGSFLARGVMRNVGRVLEMPLGQVDKLAKLVPQIPAAPVSLKQAIDSEPRLREAAEAEPRVARMLKIAQTLEGLYSNASTHAAGIVIGDRPLEELVPLYRDPKSDMPATQFNMKWVEPAGLVKFDFLGLKTLTVLDKTVRLSRCAASTIDLAEIPLDDVKTYEMLRRGETVGVFQVESAGMRKALVEMRADRFEDLIALVALYRPGPMANIPTYCAVKLGDEPADYIHLTLEPILKETFGVIIYQEQVMQIAQLLSGYSLGEADLLRRAMGKKIKAEMDAQRSRFVGGAVERGLPKARADEIFDLLAKFADYGFNKSHAAAYALLAYQTAYFKANYPVEFLAASMTLDKSYTDNSSDSATRRVISASKSSRPRSTAPAPISSRRRGLMATCRIRLRALARSRASATARRALLWRRGAHARLPISAISPSGFPPADINKQMLESLAAAGPSTRSNPIGRACFAAIEAILALAHRREEERSAGQSALFDAERADPLAGVKAESWSLAERLQREFESVGFFLSSHPLDAYGAVLQRLRLRALGRFCPRGEAGSFCRSARRRRARPAGAAHQSRQQDGYRASFRISPANMKPSCFRKGSTNIANFWRRARSSSSRCKPMSRARMCARASSPSSRSIRRRAGGQGAARLSPRSSTAARDRARPCRPRRWRSFARPGDGRWRVEVKLPGRYPANANVASSLKTISAFSMSNICEPASAAAQVAVALSSG